jgi:hypothetical protein
MRSPAIKIKKNSRDRGTRDELSNRIDIIMGRMRVISTSKIKKIIVIRKNCSEKGTRDEHAGSNPHSNGEGFSRSLNSFFPIKEFKIINKIGTADRAIERIKI